MDSRITYTSFATLNTPYESIMKENLLPSFHKFDLKYEVQYKENRGSWLLNTQYKASVLYDTLIATKGPTVMLDCDAELVQFPSLFYTLENKCDISFCNLDTYLFWHNKTGMAKREPLTGTIYVNYNANTLCFLNQWITVCEENSDKHDMDCFRIALANCNPLNIYPLPMNYVAIVGKDGLAMPSIKNPVILQHQKSRLHRRLK
jgi:hypothetical protein